MERLNVFLGGPIAAPASLTEGISFPFVAQQPLPRISVPAALGLCLLNWLIPGLGFALCKDWRRACVLFVLINICFAIGVLLGGTILPPLSWKPFTPDFNVVAVLTYLSQSFHGAGWLVLQALHGAAAETPDAYFNLRRMAASTYGDLGSFHLVVAGGLNYFATVRLYDLLAGSPELTQEHTPPTSEKAAA